MFTCSSCGYEANPDSAPACSLCGTKKPGAGGSAVRTAPKPAGDDELADVAKAVAESADAAPVPAKASGKGKAAARAGGAVATQSHTGVLRMPEQPPEIANAATVLGAFVGALIGYAFAWQQAAHAPAGMGDLVPVIGAAILFALVGRFALASMLEVRLTFSGREAFAGPIAGLVGLGFLVFTVFAFWQGGKVASIESSGQAPAQGAIGADGKLLAEHVALLTPWSLKLKNEKHAIFTKPGSPDLDIPNAKLTLEDVDAIQKAMAVAPAELERLASDDPYPTGARLPETFTIDRFLDQIGPAWGVQRDTTSKAVPGKILLTHRRTNGGEETLSIPERTVTAGDLSGALPQGVKLWVAVSLGLPAHSGQPPEHDQFVQEIMDKYGPQ